MTTIKTKMNVHAILLLEYFGFPLKLKVRLNLFPGICIPAQSKIFKGKKSIINDKNINGKSNISGIKHKPNIINAIS